MNRGWLALQVAIIVVAPLAFVLCGALVAAESDAIQANLVIEGLKESNSLLWKLGTTIVGAETATILFLMRSWMLEKQKLVEKIEEGNKRVVELLERRLEEKE